MEFKPWIWSANLVVYIIVPINLPKTLILIQSWFKFLAILLSSDLSSEYQVPDIMVLLKYRFFFPSPTLQGSKYPVTPDNYITII